MGCVLCNLIQLSVEQEPFPSASAKLDFENELAGDIAQNHPELVDKINECLGRRTPAARKVNQLQLLSGLPEVSSIGVNGDIIELELDQRMEPLLGLRGERVIFIGNNAGRLVVVVGHMVEHENIEGGIPEVLCRMKIKGSIVEFNAI